MHPFTAVNTSLKEGSSIIEVSSRERSGAPATIGEEGIEAILENVLCDPGPLGAVEGDKDDLGCDIFPVLWDGLCANRSSLLAISLLLSFAVFAVVHWRHPVLLMYLLSFLS